MRMNITFKNTKASSFTRGYIKSKARCLKNLCAPPSKLRVAIERQPDDLYIAHLEYKDPIGKFKAKSQGNKLPIEAFDQAIEKIYLDLEGRERLFNDGFYENSPSFA